MRSRRIAGILAAVLAVTMVAGAGAVKVGALDLGSVVKVGGVAILVDKFGPQLDKFINTLTANKNVSVGQATKVVPIISVRSGGYIGAAQVSGTKKALDEVKAVAQIEGNFSGRTFRVKALVPVDSVNPSKISRVKGVGVSAIIDVRV